MKLQDAAILAVTLIRKYQLDYAFRFDNSVRRFGNCDCQKKIISLSKHLTELNTEAEVRNTLLHEIAHALTPYQHHNETWQRVARSIGCNARRGYDHRVRRPKPKYVAMCPRCRKQMPRHRKQNVACGECCHKYNRGRYHKRFKLIFSPDAKL